MATDQEISSFLDGPNSTPDPEIEQMLAPPQPQKASSFMQGLITNMPTSGIPAFLGRNLPQTAGGMIGAGLAVLPSAGAGSIPMAAAGGAAGEALRQDLVSMNTGNNSPSEVLGDVAGAGISQGAGQGFNLGLKAMLGGKGAVTAGAQAIRALDATPENLASAALQHPDSIRRGLQVEAENLASKGYQAFEKYTGMKGLDAVAGERGAPWTANQLYSLATTAANKLASGEVVAPQELYLASQAQNQLGRLARFGNPDAAAMKGMSSLIKAGKAVDSALESVFPEYASLRGDRFLQAVGERFGSLFPLNKDGSVNSLRTFSALGYALSNLGKSAIGAGVGYKEYGYPGAIGGAALGMAAPFVTSPYMAGLAIRGGERLLQSQIPQTLTRSAVALPLNSVLPSATIAGRAATQGILTNYQALPTSPQSAERQIRDLSNPNK